MLNKRNLIEFNSTPKKEDISVLNPSPESYLSFLQPSRIMRYSALFVPTLWYGCLFLSALGLYLGTWVAPSDFQQGENYRILFIHVPSAWMSLLLYSLLTLTSGCFFFHKHPIFLYGSRILCTIGALFYMPYSSYRLILGKAYVGYLLGMGRTAYISTYFTVYLCWGYAIV